MKLPENLNDIKLIRETLSQFKTQLCSVADYLTDPWKTHFLQLKEQYDSALSKLPPTDQVPAAQEAHHHLNAFFSCLASANALCSMLGSAMNSLTKETDTKVATALNSAVEAELQKRLAGGLLFTKEAVDGKVTEAIEARTKAGELVAKETVTQLCSTARDLGLKDGEKKVRDEIEAETSRKQLIGTRVAHLQTCGLPVPDEKLQGLLAGTEDEFKALQTKAEGRIAALQKKGVALNSKSPLGGKVFLPDDQWAVFENLAVETLRGGDPLVAPPSTGAGAAPSRMIV